MKFLQYPRFYRHLNLIVRDGWNVIWIDSNTSRTQIMLEKDGIKESIILCSTKDFYDQLDDYLAAVE